MKKQERSREGLKNKYNCEEKEKEGKGISNDMHAVRKKKKVN